MQHSAAVIRIDFPKYARSRSVLWEVTACRYGRSYERAMAEAAARIPDEILEMADSEIVTAFNRSDADDWRQRPLYFHQLREENSRRGLHRISTGVTIYPGI